MAGSILSVSAGGVVGIALGALVIGAVAAIFIYIAVINSKNNKARETASKIIDEAIQESKTYKKEAILEAKEEIHKLRVEFDKESKDRRQEIQRTESRLIQKEESLDRKQESVEQQKKNLSNKENELKRLEANLAESNKKITAELEKVAELTREEAKAQLVASIEDEAKRDAAIAVRELEAKTKEEADKKAREILSLAIQKCAIDHTSESTVSVVPLPGDEMKGRIIGREGRNIRALESATGIDLIIDDTPEVVVLSGFDPVRREIARIALEKLISDGRIHPARIEEIVEKTRKDVENQIKEAGEAAMFETGVFNIHPELVKLLGRLKFRTSYGQNVLKHSIEVARLAGNLAGELGADIALAKRAGLLHDIGKAVDHEVEGTHIQIGADLAKKYKENNMVINAIQAHHGDVEPQTVEAVLVQTADAISGSRLGARMESLENYVKRLEKLETIANSFKGVEKSFAMQAGREVRIIVKPTEVDDAMSVLMAKDIAKKIESELEYPGQIKVNVIRETRSVEYAK